MDAGTLMAEFFRVNQRLRKVHMTEAFAELPRGEFFALDMLWEHQAKHPAAEGMYASELAQVLRSSPPAVSRGLKALEQKGYIERRVDRADRRNTYIRITPLGNEARARTKRQMLAFTERIFTQMGEADIRRLIDLWNRLADVIEKEINQQDKGEQACSKS